MSQTIKNLMMAAVAILALTLVLPLQGDAQSVYYGVGGSSYTNLFQNGSNSIDLRNGTSPQTLLAYDTYTDAANYERLSVGWDAFQTAVIETQKAGTGANRSLSIRSAGTTDFQVLGTTKLSINSNVGLAITGVTFASLGTPSNGTFVYCSDCTIAATCAAAGTGALAKRLNGVWVCN